MSRPRLKVVAKAGPVTILGPADPPPLSAFPHDPSQRGYHIVYREGETNHCPGCGRFHWWIGRLTAECAFCATALPLADPGTWGGGCDPLPPQPVAAGGGAPMSRCTARCCRGSLPGRDAAPAERLRFAARDWRGLLALAVPIGLAIWL